MESIQTVNPVYLRNAGDSTDTVGIVGAVVGLPSNGMMAEANRTSRMRSMADTHDLLDLPVIEELRETTGDAVFLEIGETFVEQITLIVSRIQEPACLNDLDCLERNAHELAGAAGAFGGSALAAHAREVMAVGRAGDLEKTRALIPSLADVSRQTLEAFARYCASPP